MNWRYVHGGKIFFYIFLKLQSLICIQKWEISLLTISQFDCFTLQAWLRELAVGVSGK